METREVSHHHWTRESIATLRQLWDEGLSATRIAMKMGLNKNQVIGKAHREDFPKRPACNAYHAKVKPVTDQQRQIVRDLWETATYARITQYTGLGEGRIKAVARELELPERNPELTRPKIARSYRKKSRAMVARPAARIDRELPVSDTRAASPSRPGAATISGVLSSAVERLGSSPQVENLPGAVDPIQPRRVFSDTECQFIYGETRGQYRFCDAPCVARDNGAASPFCAEHYALCLIPVKKAEAERKAQRAADNAAGRMRWQAASAWR
jgi:hypothetical protein